MWYSPGYGSIAGGFFVNMAFPGKLLLGCAFKVNKQGNNQDILMKYFKLLNFLSFYIKPIDAKGCI